MMNPTSIWAISDVGATTTGIRVAPNFGIMGNINQFIE